MGNKDLSYINIIYDINKENEIKIFGTEFVKNNKNRCKMVIDNKEYTIKSKYNITKYNKNKLEIKLKGIDSVTNLSWMFYGCKSLSSISDISQWNTNNITDMQNMFTGCSSLKSLPDISKFDTNNVIDMKSMFFGCYSL